MAASNPGINRDAWLDAARVDVRENEQTPIQRKDYMRNAAAPFSGIAQRSEGHVGSLNTVVSQAACHYSKLIPYQTRVPRYLPERRLIRLFVTAGYRPRAM